MDALCLHYHQMRSGYSRRAHLRSILRSPSNHPRICRICTRRFIFTGSSQTSRSCRGCSLGRTLVLQCSQSTKERSIASLSNLDSSSKIPPHVHSAPSNYFHDYPSSRARSYDTVAEWRDFPQRDDLVARNLGYWHMTPITPVDVVRVRVRADTNQGIPPCTK